MIRIKILQKLYLLKSDFDRVMKEKFWKPDVAAQDWNPILQVQEYDPTLLTQLVLGPQ